MPKRRSRWLDFAVYVVVRVVVCLIQALPPPVAWRLADLLAWLAYEVNRRHREVAADNLRHAFPELNEAQVDRLVRQTYRHCVLVAFEMMFLPRVFHRSNLFHYVRYPIRRHLDEAIAWFQTQRRLLVVTGHFGNWETFCYGTGLLGYRGGFIARRLDNPYLDRFIERFRAATGQTLFDKNHDYDKIRQAMAGGMRMGMVGDQDAGPRGLFVPFFGRPASTYKSIALLALEYRAAILVFGTARRDRPLFCDVYLEDAILPEDYADHPDPIRAITERYTAALERLVRRHPDQYFWLHRRWKSHPPERRQRRAA
jgi:Kdo2-lipid IVA lauroyltransferase/acyltransferase